MEFEDDTVMVPRKKITVKNPENPPIEFISHEVSLPAHGLVNRITSNNLEEFFSNSSE